PADVTAQQELFEWNNGSGYGTHFSLATAPPYGAGTGCLYANLRDVNSVDHYFSTAGGVLVANTWQHIALTYDKSGGSAVLYVNGLVKTQQVVGTLTPATAWDLYFGVRPAGDNAPMRYSGRMDEVSLYNHPLSGAEIQADYNASSAGKCSVTVPPT